MPIEFVFGSATGYEKIRSGKDYSKISKKLNEWGDHALKWKALEEELGENSRSSVWGILSLRNLLDITIERLNRQLWVKFREKVPICPFKKKKQILILFVCLFKRDREHEQWEGCRERLSSRLWAEPRADGGGGMSWILLPWGHDPRQIQV